MTDAEFENRMSEALFGYREASLEDMLSRARYLADLERTITLKGNKEKIVQAYEDFVNRLDDLTLEAT